ncbi:MAG TPA: ribbon-helix-helix protein, CopG family [Acidimicrobiia bacterium]|nr:ribbon-helix-helix protein, CopG family [Acidimicrobiia bacterium]
MAEKKKAYRRFEELTKRAMAPTSVDAEPDFESIAPPEPLRISLSREVRQALEQHAAAKERTPSEIVEEALRRYLNSRWAR